MKSLYLLLLAGALALASGCHRSAASPTVAAAPEPPPAATFKSGRGLQLSAAAAAFIGLQTADAGTRDLAGVKGALVIPATARLRTAKGDFVFVANGGWFLRTPVTLGETVGDWCVVREGLYEGDAVVAQGARALWLAEIQAVNGGVGCADGH
jgi:hypothetical protein